MIRRVLAEEKGKERVGRWRKIIIARDSFGTAMYHRCDSLIALEKFRWKSPLQSSLPPFLLDFTVRTFSPFLFFSLSNLFTESEPRRPVHLNPFPFQEEITIFSVNHQFGGTLLHTSRTTIQESLSALPLYFSYSINYIMRTGLLQNCFLLTRNCCDMRKFCKRNFDSIIRPPTAYSSLIFV